MVRIFYHGDMDGITSYKLMEKWLLDNKLCKKKDIAAEWVNYSERCNEKLMEVGHLDTVYVVDYSFTESTKEVFRHIAHEAANFYWIDHHDSSVKFVTENFDWIESFHNVYPFISKAGSGAYLTYLWVYECIDEVYKDADNNVQLSYIDGNIATSIPDYVTYVSDWDTFDHKYTNSKYFKAAFDFAKDEKEFIEEFVKLPYDVRLMEDTIKAGRTIAEIQDNLNANYLKMTGFESVLPDGTPIYICNKCSNSTVFGEKYHEYQYVVVFFFNGHEFKYSIFSDLKKYPDSKADWYAEKLGGGGHKGAAGWRSDKIMFKKGECLFTLDD